MNSVNLTLLSIYILSLFRANQLFLDEDTMNIESIDSRYVYINIKN